MNHLESTQAILSGQLLWDFDSSVGPANVCLKEKHSFEILTKRIPCKIHTTNSFPIQGLTQFVEEILPGIKALGTNLGGGYSLRSYGPRPGLSTAGWNPRGLL